MGLVSRYQAQEGGEGGGGEGLLLQLGFFSRLSPPGFF